MQQNLYAHMLRKNYGIDVKSMRLVQLHPDHETFKIWVLEDMRDEVAQVMRERAVEMRDGHIVAGSKKRHLEPVLNHAVERKRALAAFHAARATALNKELAAADAA